MSNVNEYYLITFESTHAAISTEKLLKPAGVTIMPVPRFISASCGISVRIHPDRREQAEQIFRDEGHLAPGEYAYYHITYEEKGADPVCTPVDL